MLKTKNIIIRNKTSDGMPCKTEACVVIRDNGDVTFVIANLFLNEKEHPNTQTLRVFKGRYLQCDAIAFRPETFEKVINELSKLK